MVIFDRLDSDWLCADDIISFEGVGDSYIRNKNTNSHLEWITRVYLSACYIRHILQKGASDLCWGEPVHQSTSDSTQNSIEFYALVNRPYITSYCLY